MSDTLADLHSQFHHHNHHHHNHHRHPMENKTPFLFPSDFPYEFASSSSNESESDDDDFSGLTRRFTRSFSLQDRLHIPYPHDPLQKKRVFSGSPESTLTWPVSGPTTPFLQAEEDPWDLIYAAAGQVARMKMEMELNMNMKMNNNNNNNLNDDVFTNRPPLLVPPPPPRHLNIGPPLSHHHHHHPNCTIWRSGNQDFIKQQQQQQFRYRVAGPPTYGGRPVGFRQPAWPPLPIENQRRQQPSNGFVAKPVLVGSGGAAAATGRVAAGIKKECAGTGVFLPRIYSNDLPESKKKPACSPANLPARVVQSLNKSMDPSLPNIYGHTHSDYGTAIGGERKAVAVGRRSGGESAEVVLPQEWTY